MSSAKSLACMLFSKNGLVIHHDFGSRTLGLLVNPVFAQFESVFFGLSLCLECSRGGFDSLNWYRLIQVAIKNQSPRVPPILRCWNCHAINQTVFITAHGRSLSISEVV